MFLKHVVVAFRHKYDSESLSEFYNSDNRFKAYIVLKDFEDKLLVIDLKKYKGQSKNFILNREECSCLVNDSVVGNIALVIFKESVVDISDNVLSDEDIWQILSDFKNNRCVEFYSEIANNAFHEIYVDYFKSKINIGSLVSVKLSENVYSLYYVLEKFEDKFLGIKLHYDYRNGLSVDGRKLYVSYYSNFDSIFYTEECDINVKRMLKK